MEDNDVHEWEFLPVEDGFLQIHDDHHTGNNIFSRRYTPYHNHHLFLTNYFVFPSLRSSLNLADPSPKQIPSDQAELELESPKPDDETVSQVSFKKLLTRENEFADMKLDSPKKISSSSSRAVLPQIDLIEYELEDGSEIPTNRDDIKSDHPKNSDGWKRTLTGLGAICSFGVVAAATFCFIIFGIQRKNNRGESKLQFQIFSDDKVHHHKNSISMPVMTTGAHITFNLEC